MPFSFFTMTPHDVEEHWLYKNALFRSTSSPTHQPRSWSKAEAPLNIELIVVTPEVSQSPMSWSKTEASWNILNIVVTPEVSHAPMSSLKDAAAVVQ